MRPSRFALVAALAAATALAGFRLASAKDEDKQGGMVPQKPISHPFADALLGTWTTENEMRMGGGSPQKGKGAVTFAKGVGGTAILETYENTGAMGVFSGHGVYKIADDGKSISCWWLDSVSPEPVKISGPLTEKSFDISAKLPKGMLRITMEKTEKGLLFKMYSDGEEMMKEEYTRATK